VRAERPVDALVHVGQHLRMLVEVLLVDPQLELERAVAEAGEHRGRRRIRQHER